MTDENRFRRLTDVNPFLRPAQALQEASEELESEMAAPLPEAWAPEAPVSLEQRSAEKEREAQIQALATAARHAKKVLDEAEEAYAGLRAQLWRLCGPGKNAAGGLRFGEPKGRRSTDFDMLEQRWPDVYAAVVNKSEPKPDAVGSLYL